LGFRPKKEANPYRLTSKTIFAGLLFHLFMFEPLVVFANLLNEENPLGNEPVWISIESAP